MSAPIPIPATTECPTSTAQAAVTIPDTTACGTAGGRRRSNGGAGPALTVAPLFAAIPGPGAAGAGAAGAGATPAGAPRAARAVAPVAGAVVPLAPVAGALRRGSGNAAPPTCAGSNPSS